MPAKRRAGVATCAWCQRNCNCCCYLIVIVIAQLVGSRTARQPAMERLVVISLRIGRPRCFASRRSPMKPLGRRKKALSSQPYLAGGDFRLTNLCHQRGLKLTEHDGGTTPSPATDAARTAAPPLGAARHLSRALPRERSARGRVRREKCMHPLPTSRAPLGALWQFLRTAPTSS